MQKFHHANDSNIKNLFSSAQECPEFILQSPVGKCRHKCPKVASASAPSATLAAVLLSADG